MVVAAAEEDAEVEAEVEPAVEDELIVFRLDPFFFVVLVESLSPFLFRFVACYSKDGF